MPDSGFKSLTNKSLFSSDYLRERLPKRSDWRHSAVERGLLDQINAIFAGAGPLLQTGNEGEVRDEVINKILAIVNPFYLSGESLPAGIEPDYMFFPDLRSKQTKDLKKAIAVGEAKPPGKNFDKTSGERSPVRQVYDYMADSQLNWGILTDGRRWRLLNRDSPTDRYFEIDLHAIATRNDTDEWLYFYNLFRREAFSSEAGPCFLDQIKEENTEYEQLVGDELKERVYSALRELAQGFVDWPENRLDQEDDSVRRQIRGACFILLYRLLFVFYAEARQLLPFDTDGYRQLSLEHLRDKVKGASRDDARFSADSRQLWTALKDLFRLVDHGSPRLGVAPYNGGLFSGSAGSLPHAAFLDRHEIADKYIARALDFLGTAPRIEDTAEYANVDYAGLEIRHLGSIYEGLLEFHLAYANTDLVSVRRKRSETWVPMDRYTGRLAVDDLPPERRAKAGELYLETTRHERRSTGSYYTSQPVVSYIVQHTLGPMVMERIAVAKRTNQKQSDAILSIRVCDPAMGSGHFLVEAVRLLSEALIAAIEQDQQAGLLPLNEYDLDWAKREVVRRCIYGVDMNDLAVELAKVSLWLATVSRDKPLSFLDHRLRLGNSLLGASLARLKRYPAPRERVKHETGDRSLPDFISRIFVDRLIGKIQELDRLGDDRVEDIKRKEKLFAEFKGLPEYEKAKAIADVWTSVHLGNEVTPTEKKPAKEVYYDLIYALDYPENWEPKTESVWFKQAIHIAQQKRLFHWELEFPEVLLAGAEEGSAPGFDAIVTNPPYVSALQLAKTADPRERDFMRATFVSKGAFDLYIPFLELGQRLVRRGGRSGLITPNKFLAAPYGKELRRLLAQDSTLERLLDASQADVFEDPAVYPIVTVFLKKPPEDADRVTVEVLRRGDSVPTLKGLVPHNLLSAFPDSLWSFLVSKDVNLISRLARECQRLQPNIARVQASTTAAESDLFKQVMVDSADHPEEAQHLHVVNTGLIDRYENMWGRIPLTHAGRKYIKPCVRRDDPRLSQMRRDLFSKPKLIVAKIAHVPEICPDLIGMCAAVNVNFVVDSAVDLRALMAVLNSRLMGHIYRDYFGALTMQGADLQFQAPQLRILPIPVVEPAVTDDSEAQLLAEALGFSAPIEGVDQDDMEKVAGTLSMERVHALSRQRALIPAALAILASAIVRSHETKNESSWRFIDWIRSPAGLGVDLENLTNGQKILRFWEDPQLGSDGARRSLESILSKGGVVLKASQVQSLAGEYSKVSSALVPVLGQLARFELFVDLLVYTFYKLTLSEIAMVEDLSEEEARRKYQWESESPPGPA